MGVSGCTAFLAPFGLQESEHSRNAGKARKKWRMKLRSGHILWALRCHHGEDFDIYCE